MMITSCRLAMMRRHRELPLEAQRQVDHDADDHEAQRLRAVGGQFGAHLRADELGRCSARGSQPPAAQTCLLTDSPLR
jgi:hypothetical protein